jgi:sarcosine oxidase subunit alpha
LAAAPRWTTEIDGQPVEAGFPPSNPTLAARDNVTIRTRTCGFGVYDHGYVLADERVADHTPGDGRPKHRLWRIRTGKIVTATGAIERPLSFAGQRHSRRDAGLRGARLCGELRRCRPGDRTVVVTNNDRRLSHRAGAQGRGLTFPRSSTPAKPLTARCRKPPAPQGIRVLTGKAIASVKGGKRVTGVAICAQAAGEGAVQEEIACDAVAMSGGWSPVVHLWSHCGGKLTGMRPSRPSPRPDPSARP